MRRRHTSTPPQARRLGAAALWGALAWTGMAAPLQAQSADGYTPPKVGLVVVYAMVTTAADEKGAPQTTAAVSSATIVQVDADEITYERSATPGAQKIRILRGIASIENLWVAGRFLEIGDHGKLRALWPLAAGRTVTYASEAQLAPRNPKTMELEALRSIGQIEQTWTVRKEEPLIVPAGSFDTVLLHRRYRVVRPGGGAEEGEYRIWFAPALGWYVRFEGTLTAPRRAGIVQVAREIRGR